MAIEAIIYIVDDTPEILDIASSMIETKGYTTQCYGSGIDFLKSKPFAKIGCILLDNQMPQLSGLEVQQQLNQEGISLPVVFMSGDSNYSDVFDATRSGALAFLQKPFSIAELLEKIEEAIEHSIERAETENSKSVYQKLVDQLTSREKEVYDLVVQGKKNKDIAQELAISVSTVEFHRSNLMKKLKVTSITQLIANELSLHR